MQRDVGMEGREGRRGREIEKEIRGGRVEKRRVGMVVGESRITVARRSINCPQVLFSLPRYFIYRQNVSLCACHGNADRIGTVNRAYFFSSFPFFFFFQSQAIIAGIPNFSLTLSLSLSLQRILRNYIRSIQFLSRFPREKRSNDTNRVAVEISQGGGD